MNWQPIATCPCDRDVLLWVVPKTADEAWQDTAGTPIVAVATFPGFMKIGRRKQWSGLSKGTHWMPLPAPPDQEPAE